MDFWAQHKEFILKVLAGVGVFLVALLARSITYGDELETERAKNASLSERIRAMRIAAVPDIQALEADRDRLLENARAIAGQVGWSLAGGREIERELLTRILRATRRYARESEAEVARAVEGFRQALRDDLNGGFGQLRLLVRQELVEEASESGIQVPEGIGYENVTELEPDDLMQYLLQLELVARVVRYAIDAGVDAIKDVRITAEERRDPAVRGANPEFLEEYAVTVAFEAGQPAAVRILDRLEAEPPRVPLTGLEVRRLERPADHLAVRLTVRALAANPDVPFAPPEKAP